MISWIIGRNKKINPSVEDFGITWTDMFAHNSIASINAPAEISLASTLILNDSATSMTYGTKDHNEKPRNSDINSPKNRSVPL
jgi:hypothetical protein